MRRGLYLSVMYCWLTAAGVSSFLTNSHRIASFAGASPARHVVEIQKPTSSSLSLVDISSLSDTSDAIVTAATSFGSSGILVAETESWVQPTALVLGPFLNFMSFTMLCRVVASWYPETNLNELPWAIVAWPSEPLLRLVKGAIPPAFGVDITPVFWLAIFTFLNEILLGQQGLLVMKMKYGI